MSERQCPAGLFINDDEYRCELPKWHAGRHQDEAVEWSASEH